MGRINVLIADDHTMLRQGIKQILELEKDITVVALASDGAEAIRLVRMHRPDVVLMDINMPSMNGLQAIKELKAEKSPVRIIVLTMHEEKDYLFKALQLGAEGYVLKDADPMTLIDAIRSVYRGQNYIQPNMTKELVREFNRMTFREKGTNQDSLLTSRELEVLDLIAEGMINKEIAKKLFISEKTVKNHVSNIFRKLNVSDRTQAAIYAFKHNLKV